MEFAEKARDMTHTHVTAPTQFVEANGIRFAYRCFGIERGVPLLFMAAFPWRDGPLGSHDHGWIR